MGKTLRGKLIRNGGLLLQTEESNGNDRCKKEAEEKNITIQRYNDDDDGISKEQKMIF